MSSQQLRIQMVGGGPYGFRLLGGDKNPLSVSKIRPSSKAQVAGILEGDVILAINDINCQGLSHSAATGLMESNSTGLTVLILRGKTAISDAHSVMASLGPDIRQLNDAEANALAQRHSNQIQAASDNFEPNGYSSEGTFRLSAPPSGENLKQIRISRRESQSGDLQTPQIVIQAPVENPNYYTREERTSNDGGKTTRIVEEVKTEKFGGTTLTKVTKQEFTSYSTSPHDQPTYSIIRSEEQGQPVSLGAPSFEEGIPTDGRRLVDERGWTTTSNVERRSIKTQPFEGHVKVVQEPASSWVVYQDGVDHGNLVKQGQSRNQSIPAIEIHFEPNENGFIKEVKTSGTVQPMSLTDSDFKVRIGKEVTFQPHVQVHSAWTQDQYEYQPATQSQTYQKPRIEVEQRVYSNISTEQRQSRDPYDSDLQPLRAETQAKYHYDSSNQTRSDQQFQRNADPEFRYGRGNIENIGPSLQFVQTKSRSNPEFPANPNSYSRDLQSSHQSKIIQSEFYDDSDIRSESQRKNPSQKNDRCQIHSNSNPQSSGHKQEPPPTGNNNPQSGYYPDDEQEYTAIVHHPNQAQQSGTDRTGKHCPAHHNADTKYPPSGQYDYNRAEEPSYEADQYQTDNYRDQSGYDTASNYRPVASVQRGGFEAGPTTNDPAHFGETEPTRRPNYEPIVSQRLPGIKELQKKNVPCKQQVPERAFVEADHASVPPHLRRFEASENVTGIYHGSAGRPNISRQPDRVERVEIGTATKWIAGSKLPTARPLVSHESKGASVGDSRANPEFERGQVRDEGSGYHLSREDGWYEATAPGGKGLPSAAPSIAYDQKGETNEPRLYPVIDNAGQYDDEVQRRSGVEYPYIARGEQSDWPVHGHMIGHGHPATSGHQGPKNTRMPSNQIQGSNFPRHYDQYDEEWERPLDPNDVMMHGPGSDARYQPAAAAAAPPPPAPPLMPYRMTGPSPSVPPMYSPPQEPQTRPPPAAPPIDRLKIYRGNAPSDSSYGFTSLEDRVKVANSMALSVLAPENKNSRGQKIFLRRRENSHKWTTQGPDPVPEKAPQQPEPARNAWAPRLTEQTRPSYPPSAPAPQPSPFYRASSLSRLMDDAPSNAYSLTDDTALNSGKGGALFAKRRLKSEKWASHESPGSRPTPPPSFPPSGYDAEGQTGKKYAIEQRGPGASAVHQLPPAGAKWQQQSQPFEQDGQSRGGPSYGHGPVSTGFASDPSPAPQGYRQIRFQGTPRFSPSPATPPTGQTQHPLYQGQKFAPRQLGFKAAIAQGAGYTDL